MRKERQIALVERLLSVMGKGPEETCHEGTIDVERYTSPSRLEAEQRALFRNRPIIVGRTSDLPGGGSFFTHDSSGVPILVTRDVGGRVHAMLNVCRHRGTRLVTEESGSGVKSFVCPYHAWTYDLCGQLGHIPLSRCFPTLERDESALVELPCAIRHGFIWVIPRPSRRGESFTVSAWLGDFDEDLTAFELDKHIVFERSEAVRNANWKLVMDAFLEGYHVKSLHQHTLSRFFAEDVIVDVSSPHVRSVGARRNLPQVMNTSKDAWNIRACTTVFYNLFPNSVLVFHPDMISHVALFPKSINEVVFVHTMLAPHEPRDEAERAAWQKTWELIDHQVFATEDLVIAESIQSVLHADAQRTFRLGSLEHPIRMFHDAIDEAIAQSSARSSGRNLVP
jgi:phenylpropionate dioxygenase-like ring-hydroxylating dioxygenase large terminal subunit